MDASFTRRGQPCWYKVEKVGTIAINDSFMLEAALYRLLKKYYRKDPYYVDLLELFLDVRELNLFRISILIACRTHPPQTTYYTEMGQLLDLLTAPEDHVDLSKFSLERCVPWCWPSVFY